MKLLELLTGAGIDCPENKNNIEIQSIISSSKRAENGSMFVCLCGLRSDGHSYIEDARRRGAKIIIAQKGRIPEEKCADDIILVDNTRAALAKLLSVFYGEPQKNMKIIGITGTNGKTTTSRMLYEILKKWGKRCGYIGTVGSFAPSGMLDIVSDNKCANMTTPDPEELYKILSVMERDRAEFVIMEVSSHSLHLDKVAPIEFEYGLFTNLTEDHLDFHKDMESYYIAKRKLFSQSKKAIINIDDIYGRRLADEIISPVRVTAEGREAQYMATEIKYNGYSGLEYKMYSRLANLRVRTSIPGRFTVYNSLMAIACAIEIGVPISVIRYAMLDMKGTDGRLERVELPPSADFSVFIDYAHTPDALENLLKCAISFKKKRNRIVLVFGCGGDRDRDKRKIMGRIATNLADHTIITSDNPRSEDREKIIFDILLGVDKEADYNVISDRREAIRSAIANAKAGDIILLAGKGHEKYEIVGNDKKYFNEKEIVISSYLERIGI